jgi:hypothetical protein
MELKMQTFAKTIAAAAALVAMGAAHADVSFNANIENDTTHTAAQGATASDTANGGRVEMNVLAALAKSGDNFVNAKGTLLIKNDGTTAVDDAWIQFGNAKADLKVGRQEAADLFPLGKDVVVSGANPSASGYRANKLRGRMADGRFHGVLGFNAAPGLRLEMGLVTKKTGSTINEYGVRPTVAYTAGALTLRAGFESFKTTGAAKDGYGLSAGYAINSSTNLNVNYAKSSDLNASSTGVNLVAGAAGVGYVQDKTGTAKQNTYYAAYSFPLFDIKGATITPAISHSTSAGVESLNAFRVRLNYAF